MKSSIIESGLRCGLIAALGCALASCSTTSGDHVIAATGTVIGLEVAQAATGSPALKLGYDRAELAYVPTNRRVDTNGAVTGADVTAEVLMELRYGGIGSTAGNTGIYQRLAVGKTAVTQAGAALMFAKGNDGEVDANAAAAIQAANKAVVTIPGSKEVPTAEAARLRVKYQAASATDKALYDAAAGAAGYAATSSATAFLMFTGDLAVTQAKVDQVKAELKQRGLNPDAP
jgi:hypothetical protein